MRLRQAASTLRALSMMNLKSAFGDVLYNFNQSTLYRHGYIAACWVARKKKTGNEGVGGKKKVVGSGVFDKLKEKWL